MTVDYEKELWGVPELDEYLELLDEMYAAAMSTILHGKDDYAHHYLWGLRLQQEIQELCPLDIDQNDVFQQICLIWWQSWKTYKGSIQGLKRYLIQRTIWGLRDWLIKQSNIVGIYPYYYFLEEKPEFLLDLSFLAYGTRVYPFSTLAPYERYLIFLRYREEKTILQISKVVCKNKNTVQKELCWILDKLRVLGENFEKENSGRSCSRGDGWASAKGECSEGCSPWNQATPPEAYQ